MNKKLIRLTESDLHKIVKESVGKIINEIGDTPKGQRGLGGLHARKVLRNNDLSDDTYNYAQNARGGDKYDNRGNNENPLYHDYANGYIDYLNSHPDEYMVNKRKRMSESYLHRIVKESVNRILGEDQEGYNQVMSTLNSPTAQKGLKKAWNKERKRNPNADYDTFEYNHALNLQNKKMKESVRKVMREASIYPGYDSTTTEDIADNGGDNIITCYGSPGIINGKYQGSGAATILGPGVIYLSCNSPTREMTRMYGQLVPVKVDVSNFYRAKDALEAKKMVGLVGFKDKYSGILYHGNRDGDVCAVFDRNCIIG